MLGLDLQWRPDAKKSFIIEECRAPVPLGIRDRRRRAFRENVDDLFQIGCIGLIKAIDNFDLSQNVKFSTYAVPMILGEVRRYLRDNNSIRVSRSLRVPPTKRCRQENFSQENLREPTIMEIADEVGISKEEIPLRNGRDPEPCEPL